ncbi:RagB/SusD family nutrient uptake outer membrane protein [Chryseobacterium sp. H3056]|uniref:RagB/SusD family nutrient uptake outer membrane protein n=1 Tax=Kaistella daneshvariae TaxID=2487074 RepID=A0A3N0WRY1_9FLAO|nr:RagB/SusD family nutrient uptake outer membrane protein [Kaistella daneshvariae]ROI07675.1 RagB/SusD family nutrient uptake outer membrane protein [Kaistella daneshvariae]
MKYIFKIGMLSLGMLAATSCSNDFVDREFEQSVIQGDLTTVQEIQSFVRGAYVSMRSSTYYGRDYLAYGEIRSDEMFSNGGSGYYNTVRQYTMLSSDAYARDTYNQIYTMIGKTNIVINTDIAKVKGTTADIAKAEYYQGQAYALRGQGFFDLLKLYGQKYSGGTLGVVTPTKYDPKALQARSTITETEAQIESDFNKALEVMTAKAAYDTPSNKTELSLNALKVLMSRFYLYKGDYAKVRKLTDELYGKYSVVARDLYQPSFDYTLRGAAPNAIFELEVGTDSSLSTSSYNQILSYNGYKNLVVQESTLSLYATNDIRRNLITKVSGVNYLSYSTRGKYLNRTGADNIKMIRYEEVLLNGAEAELNGGDPAKALKYYKEILANRLGVVTLVRPEGTSTANLSAAIAQAVQNGASVSAATTYFTTIWNGLDAIANPSAQISVTDQINNLYPIVTLDLIKAERKKELLGEGFRQWDLLRWGDTSFKPATVDINKLAFPIPRSETDIAGSPVVANPGYDN